MIWRKLDVGDFRLLLLVELALRRREGTLTEYLQEEIIGGMIDDLNLIEGIGIVILMTDEIIGEIQGIGLVSVLDQGYVYSLPAH